MVEPRQAPVEPRIVRPGGTYALPLADEIRALIEEGARGPVCIFGLPGAGKTTALQHLAAVLPADVPVLCLDEPGLTEVYLYMSDHLVVYTVSNTEPAPSRVGLLKLAPWTRDELVEYLLAAHKDKCAGVMARLPARGSLPFDGSPAVWRIILDEMARDAALPSTHDALSGYLRAQMADTKVVSRARYACLHILAHQKKPTDAGHLLSAARLDRDLEKLLRHREVQILLAAEHAVSELRADSGCEFLRARLPADLIRSVGASLAKEPALQERLKEFLAGPNWSHAMTASLLLAADKNWKPGAGSVRHLVSAYLEGAKWPGAQLAEADLTDADFSNADLRGANLDRAQARSTNLQGAILREASLAKLQAHGANFSGADLVRVRAEDARFVNANLEGADLSEAFLKDSSFREAYLSGATFRGADLTKALLLQATLSGADFSGAQMVEAILDGVRLRDASFKDVRLPSAHLRNCDLEEMDLNGNDFRHADLEGALLTASSADNANFTGAILRQTGLAEINWERASLRDADLRGATFHMGGTRSGLVGSPIACEGSRTGFYTDDYEEQHFKAPEEIRKADLRGADLRGAKLGDVDFYLVDLRDALYDPEQAEHFRRYGAILEARV